jgi:hypothetical protein
MKRKPKEKTVTDTRAHREVENLRCLVPTGAGVFIYRPARYPQSADDLLKRTRNRVAEFYLNGACLVRAISSRAFHKVPFFLRHLCCAIAKRMERQTTDPISEFVINLA